MAAAKQAKAAKGKAAQPSKKGASADVKPQNGTLTHADVSPKPDAAPAQRVTAEQLAEKQRDISVSEFFAKNRHLLGFDNPTRALLTAIKEAVDNSLDACEEAGILPELVVEIEQKGETRYRIAVQDNGPGIVKQQIPAIFGKLLYGSKFHTLKMSRGQQGIGISAAGLYAQLTTGKGMTIHSRTHAKKKAWLFEVHIDTTKNAPVVGREEEVDWTLPHGTRVEMELEARYQKGPKSVDDYIRQTAVANPHVTLTYRPPLKEEWVVYKRATTQLPKETKAIRPHPYGVELGVLIKMLQGTKSRRLKAFLSSDFSRVSPRLAGQICAKAGIPDKSSPSRIAREEAEKLYKAINETKIMAPPTDCLAPIGEASILAGLKAMVKGASCYVAKLRAPSVYRGNPFQIEAGIAYGGDLPAEEPAAILRYANRVPLLYQQGACCVTKAVVGTDWRNYGLSQSKGSPPIGPMVIFAHMASVWVPFTSEAKEAIAHYAEILKEIKLALQECGRQLAQHLRRHQRAADQAKRRSIFESYAGVLARSLSRLSGAPAGKIQAAFEKTAKKVTKAMDLEEKKHVQAAVEAPISVAEPEKET